MLNNTESKLVLNQEQTPSRENEKEEEEDAEIVVPADVFYS